MEIRARVYREQKSFQDMRRTVFYKNHQAHCSSYSLTSTCTASDSEKKE